MVFKSCQKFLPIFTSLSPNVEKNDISLVLKLLFQPWKWKKDSEVEILEEEFKKYLGVKYVFSFNSGRSAFLTILESLSLERGSEVLIQAFTCNAVVNPIIHLGLKPVFVDIEESSLNISPSDLEKKVSPKSRVVVAQHTFGLPASLDEILRICQNHNLILIEDCAHSLGAEYNGRKVGNFSRASFFSFGRDKIISSVYGGMATTNDDALAEKIKKIQKQLPHPSSLWILQQLLHPIITKFFIIPLYGFFGLGRWFLIVLQKAGILSKAVHNREKAGEMPFYFPQKMPDALAILALNQFRKLEQFIAHQKEIAGFYTKNLKEPGFILPSFKEGRVYMRYPLLIESDTDGILKEARKKKIFLDDGWRKTPVAPPDTNQEKMGYLWGSCPKAEKIVENILNLPTHINISQKEAKRIINFLNQNPDKDASIEEGKKCDN